MDRQAWTLRQFNRKRARIGEDFCDLISTTLTSDGSSGQTLSIGTVATNIPCYYEQLSSSNQEVAGGVTYNRTHRITMQATSAALLVDGQYQVKVLSRGSNPQMIFEQPAIEKSTYSPLVKIVCTLTDGFRDPGLI